ncbi:MAG: transcriptional repressor [Fermentimonas sp.]|nr:transcriptional repressor [Fermentimonas sp.]
MITAEEILRKQDLRSTACRKFIINGLLKSDRAMSENELKGNFHELFDRVTFYRSLITLEDSGIIHKIVLNDNSVKYALNSHHHNENNLHSHFHCEECDEVLCLEGKTRFEAELPDDYVTHGVFVVIEGICADCINHTQSI